MLVDHEKVLAKAYELLPHALNELATQKLKLSKTTDLSRYEIVFLRLGILMGVLKSAGEGCSFDTMGTEVKIDDTEIHVKTGGTAPSAAEDRYIRLA